VRNARAPLAGLAVLLLAWLALGGGEAVPRAGGCASGELLRCGPSEVLRCPPHMEARCLPPVGEGAGAVETAPQPCEERIAATAEHERAVAQLRIDSKLAAEHLARTEQAHDACVAAAAALTAGHVAQQRAAVAAAVVECEGEGKLARAGWVRGRVAECEGKLASAAAQAAECHEQQLNTLTALAAAESRESAAAAAAPPAAGCQNGGACACVGGWSVAQSRP
jgi:hypothetical protein